jgi:hypothetical protein
MTPSLRVTLAHELTHVLQDQHFNIKKSRFASMTSQGKDDFRAIIEGDANRIEKEYVGSLSADDKASYQQTSRSDVDNATSGLEDVPQALIALQNAPYELGQPFVDLLMANGGQSVLDGAFDKPPASDEQLLDPSTYFRHEAPLKLDAPTAPDGVANDQIVDDGDFGATSLFIVLAERIDPLVALKAVNGWGGDAYLTYQQNGKTCVRINFQGDTPNDDDEMRTALDQWIQAMPSGAARESTQNGLIQLETCDPGTDSGLVVNDRSQTAVALLSVRLQYTQAAVKGLNVSIDKAFTFGDCFVNSLGFDNLTAPDSPQLEAAVNSSIAECKAAI